MDSHTHETFGRIGVWCGGLQAANGDATRRGEVSEAVAELDELGYGTVWLGGSPSVADAAIVVDAAPRITVATGILSIWDHTAKDVAEQVAELEEHAPGRFVLGLGASHSVLAPQYAKPYSAMVSYLDSLDTAAPAAGRTRRVLAALGPKMLRLSADRSLGAHPYLVTTEYVAQARAALGPQPLLAPELKVVLDTDLDRARATARDTLQMYLQLPNYTGNLLRLGFEEADFAGGGSDRLVDGLFALGDTERAKERIDAYLAAGADHVALQALVPDGTRTTLPLGPWRELAAALALR